MLAYNIIYCELLPSHVWRVQAKSLDKKIDASAGQYLFVSTDAQSQGLPFSMANFSADNDIIELHIRDQKDVVLQQIISACNKNGSLYFSAGHGLCAYESIRPQAKNIILAVGGTGFAMAQSILQAADHAHDNRNWFLYFNATTEKGFYYLDSINQMRGTLNLKTYLINRSSDKKINSRIISDFTNIEQETIILSAGPCAFVQSINAAAKQLGLTLLTDMPI